MLPRDQEQLLQTLLDLRPDGPALVVIVSRRMTAGAEIVDYSRSRLGFEVVDLLEGSPPLADLDQLGRRRLLHGLPFLTPPRRRALLDRLNRGRDLIERLSLQLVVWVLDEDQEEFSAVAPDLASWVDEWLPWEGEPEPREVYALQAAPPHLDTRELQHETRGGGSAAPVVWIPDDLRELVDPERLDKLLRELSLIAGPPVVARSLPNEAAPLLPSVVDEVLEIHPKHVASVLFLRGPDSALGRLQLDLELTLIQRAAQEHGHQVCAATVTSPSDLVDAIAQHPAPVLHYGGHSRQQGPVLLQGTDGLAKPMHPQALRRILDSASHHARFQCIVLNTSDSQRTAEHLLEPPAVASCVVAGQGGLLDDIAVAFSSSFYSMLFRGLSIRHAFDQALADVEAEHGEVTELGGGKVRREFPWGREPYALLVGRA